MGVLQGHERLLFFLYTHPTRTFAGSTRGSNHHITFTFTELALYRRFCYHESFISVTGNAGTALYFSGTTTISTRLFNISFLSHIYHLTKSQLILDAFIMVYHYLYIYGIDLHRLAHFLEQVFRRFP